MSSRSPGSVFLRPLTIEQSAVRVFYLRVGRDPPALWSRSRFRTGHVPAVTFPPASLETAVGPTRLLRKEVIQPHLPIRLPCYDFIPLTSHSFGAFPPFGLDQRLREQPTRVM